MSSARPSATTSGRGGAPVWGPSRLAVAASAMAATAVARMTTPICWTLIGSPVKVIHAPPFARVVPDPDSLCEPSRLSVSTQFCSTRCSSASMPQNFPQRREPRHLIAERFECGGDRDREEHARDTPDEPPKQHADHDRERVELQPAGIDE